MHHEIRIKGQGKNSYATCGTCPDPIDYHQNKTIARGSRNHVNRQVKIHRSKIRRVK